MTVIGDPYPSSKLGSSLPYSSWTLESGGAVDALLLPAESREKLERLREQGRSGEELNYCNNPSLVGKMMREQRGHWILVRHFLSNGWLRMEESR